jgi:hypothetical protein
MSGEKTTYPQLEKAVEECGDYFGCQFIEFAVYPDLSEVPGCYTIFLESVKPELKFKQEEVSNVMAQKLYEVNPDLQFAVEQGSLGHPKVKFVNAGTFRAYRDMRVETGLSQNQQKPVRIIDTPERKQFFLLMIQ